MRGSSSQIAIVLYPGFTALDALGPYEVFKYLPGADIRFVNHEVGPVPNDRGQLVVAATHELAETSEPDVILVPGSEANTPVAMADEALRSWLRQAHETSKITASVCSGALVLGAAGLLEGRKATTHWFGMSSLDRFGAEAMPDMRVVRDGKIATAAGVSAGIDLALELFEELAGREEAEVAQLLIEYDPQPHLSAGHVSKASDTVRRRALSEMRRLSRTPTAYAAVSKLAWQGLIRRARAKKAART